MGQMVRTWGDDGRRHHRGTKALAGLAFGICSIFGFLPGLQAGLVARAVSRTAVMAAILAQQAALRLGGDVRRPCRWRLAELDRQAERPP